MLLVSGQLPPEEYCPPVRVRVWVKVRVIFRVGSNHAIATSKVAPRLGLGFGLELVLGLRGGAFSSGAIVLEPLLLPNIKFSKKKQKAVWN